MERYVLISPCYGLPAGTVIITELLPDDWDDFCLPEKKDKIIANVPHNPNYEEGN